MLILFDLVHILRNANFSLRVFYNDGCLINLEQALSAHFGTPVRLRLVAEEGEAGSGRGDRAAAPPPGAEPDEHYDAADLVDAPPASVRTPLDHLTEAFPGAELLEEP